MIFASSKKIRTDESMFERCVLLSVGQNKARLSSSANEAEEKGAMETNELRY